MPPTGRFNIIELSSTSAAIQASTSSVVTLSTTSITAISSSTILLGAVSANYPATADLLSGSLQGSSGVLLTVPASRAWKGTIAIQASVAQAAGQSAGGTSIITAFTTTGITPGSVNLCQVAITGVASTSTSSAGLALSGNMSVPDVCVIAGTSGGVISLSFTNNAGATNFGAVATGQML